MIALAGCAATQHPAPVRERAPVAREKPVLPPPVAPGHYRIQSGDTLYKIAFEQGRDVLDLAAWNRIADPDRIRAGDVLRVIPPPPVVVTRVMPPPPAVTVKPLSQPVATPAPVRQVSLVSAPEPTVPVAPVISDDAPPDTWSWPLRGAILARFGEGLSKGIDIAGTPGKPVLAAASGRVVYAGSGLRGYGKLIIIRHGKTLLSAYAHNARILVGEGDNVIRGQVVGEVGDTDAERVKLHFEIREQGRPVDPLIYLPNAG